MRCFELSCLQNRQDLSSGLNRSQAPELRLMRRLFLRLAGLSVLSIARLLRQGESAQGYCIGQVVPEPLGIGRANVARNSRGL